MKKKTMERRVRVRFAPSPLPLPLSRRQARTPSRRLRNSAPRTLHSPTRDIISRVSQKIVSLLFKKSLSLSYFLASVSAARPAGVISPRRSRSAQRCLFSSVQWLPFRRGESLWAHRPSGSRF